MPSSEPPPARDRSSEESPAAARARRGEGLPAAARPRSGDEPPAPASGESGAEPSTTPLAHVAVVLVEPTEPGNVGAVARVMLNLGARELRLVVADPARREELLGCEARARACDGVVLLKAAKFFDELRGALAGVSRAYAFTSRVGKFRPPRGTLEQAGARAAAERPALAAFVFGREDRGLEDPEVAQAHEIVAIPAPGPTPVLNLSHAVTIALWEALRAASGFTPFQQHRTAPRVASAEDRAALRDDAARLLVELGLGPGQFGDLHGRILRRIVDLFDRAGAEHSDFSMLQGLFVSFRRRLDEARRGVPPVTGDAETD